MLAEIGNYRPKEMYYTFGSCHVYKNHVEQCKQQLSRKPYDFPIIKLNHKDDIDNFTLDDFKVENYQCHPKIVAEVAV